VDDTIAIAALIQAITAKLYKLYEQNLGFRIYHRALIQENKWRAARWGLDGKLIDFGKQTEVPTREVILELLEFVDDVVDGLGSREEINGIYKILERGTSADRQIQVYNESGGDLQAVVDLLMKETVQGVL
jgi:carboxylate-amine ligase